MAESSLRYEAALSWLRYVVKKKDLTVAERYIPLY
jgi:hypothetical protein